MRISELHNLTIKCAVNINEALGYEAIEIRNITDVTYNARLKRSLGRAIKNRFTNKFRIEFSKKYFEHNGTSLDDKKSIVYHELIHTIDGCFNHGHKFNSISYLIERKTGVKDIAGRFKKDDNGFRKANAKYTITCKSCGNVGYRHKTMLRYTNRKEGRVHGYGCGKCGGDHLEQSINREA